MGELIRIRIADALHNRQAAGFKKVGRGPHRRVQAKALADLEEFVGRQPQFPTAFRITFVAERDDSVDPVIPAVELKGNEHAAVAIRGGGTSRPLEKRWHYRREREERRAFQKSTPRDHEWAP